MKPGDTVMLKSGGPIMTISSVCGGNLAGHVDCTWFEGAKVVTAVFPISTLKLVKPPDTDLAV